MVAPVSFAKRSSCVVSMPLVACFSSRLMASGAVVPRRVWGEEIEIAFSDSVACSVHASTSMDGAGFWAWKPTFGRTAMIVTMLLLCSCDKEALSFDRVMFGIKEGVADWINKVVNMILL